MNIGNVNQMENGLYVSVDWITFTVLKNMSYQDVIAYFGLNLEQFQTGLNGAYGYKSRVRHSIYPISVMYDGKEGMGICVTVSGSAVGYFLRSYLNYHTNCKTPFNDFAYDTDSFDATIFSDVLRDILEIGQLTRLDLAIDDLGCNYYTLPELADIFYSGSYVSRFRNFKTEYSGGKCGCTGHTIYLGSRKSELMFRIYDKQLEQRGKGKEVNSPWVRWEIELHKDRACAAALMLSAGKSLSDVAIGIFSNYLRLINKDNVRDSRCSTSEKWLAFIDGISKLTLCQPIPEKTLEDKKEWLRRQVAPTASAIYQIDGDLSFFYELISSGSSRISSELYHIITNELERIIT